MKKIIKYFVLAVGIFSFMSCARGIVANDAVKTNDIVKDVPCDCSANYTPTKISLTVKSETKKMLWSHIDKIAGAETEGLTYYFVMHENKAFSVIVNMHGTKQYEFRAGTFQSKGDTLNLNYYKNLTSAYLTDRVLVDDDKNEVHFLSAGAGKTTSLKMLNHIPRALIVMLFKQLPKDKDKAFASAGTNSAPPGVASR